MSFNRVDDAAGGLQQVSNSKSIRTKERVASFNQVYCLSVTVKKGKRVKKERKAS